MIASLIKSFFIGAISYIMTMLWVGWGSLPPTMQTTGVGYILNAVALIFWVISFVIYEKLRIDYERLGD